MEGRVVVSDDWLDERGLLALAAEVSACPSCGSSDWNAHESTCELVAWDDSGARRVAAEFDVSDAERAWMADRARRVAAGEDVFG